MLNDGTLTIATEQDQLHDARQSRIISDLRKRVAELEAEVRALRQERDELRRYVDAKAAPVMRSPALLGRDEGVLI